MTKTLTFRLRKEEKDGQKLRFSAWVPWINRVKGLSDAFTSNFIGYGEWRTRAIESKSGSQSRGNLCRTYEAVKHCLPTILSCMSMRKNIPAQPSVVENGPNSLKRNHSKSALLIIVADTSPNSANTICTDINQSIKHTLHATDFPETEG